MRKKDFVSSLAENFAVTETLANDMLNVFLGTIEDSLLNGQEVNFQWFGKFSLSKRKPKTGYNLHTGINIPIKGFTLPVFKAGKVLKRKIRTKFN